MGSWARYYSERYITFVERVIGGPAAGEGDGFFEGRRVSGWEREFRVRFRTDLFTKKKNNGAKKNRKKNVGHSPFTQKVR